MKLRIITSFLLIYCSLAFSQINPEDLIIIYDSENPEGKVLVENELRKDSNFINAHQLEEKKKELLTKKDSNSIQKLTTGNWSLKRIEKLDGTSYNLQVFEKIYFDESGKFKIIENDEVISGEWQINQGEIELKYDEPQYQISNKEMLRVLSESQRESLMYTSNILSVHSVDKDKLIFIHFLPEFIDEIDDILFLLVLSKYSRMD